MTPAHTLVAKACLGILFHLNQDVPAKASLGTLLPMDENVVEDALQQFPLASYAALHWADHARFEGVSGNGEDGMNILLDLSKPHLALWISLHNTELPSWKLFKRGEWPLPTIGKPLHYATICGLHAFVKVLIDEHLHYVDFRDFKNMTPLHMASLRGYEQVARVLLECGADVRLKTMMAILRYMWRQERDNCRSCVSFLSIVHLHQPEIRSGRHHSIWRCNLEA
jgi:hypothetical protein